MALSCNQCCNGKAIMHSVCVVELHVGQQYKNSECCTNMILWRIYVTSNAVLHVQHAILLSDFNQIWIVSTEFYKSPKYQISRKSVQCESRWYMWTDGQTDRKTDWHDETNKSFSLLCGRSWNSLTINYLYHFAIPHSNST